VVDQVQLKAPQILDGGAIGRAPEEGGEPAHGADVGSLRLVAQLAHAHVVEHALAKRRDRANRSVHGPAPVDERGGLPRSSTSQNPRPNESDQASLEGYRASGLVLRPVPVIPPSRRPVRTMPKAAPQEQPCGNQQAGDSSRRGLTRAARDLPFQMRIVGVRALPDTRRSR
jgi:hypothetical protein